MPNRHQSFRGGFDHDQCRLALFCGGGAPRIDSGSGRGIACRSIRSQPADPQARGGIGRAAVPASCARCRVDVGRGNPAELCADEPAPGREGAVGGRRSQGIAARHRAHPCHRVAGASPVAAGDRAIQPSLPRNQLRDFHRRLGSRGRRRTGRPCRHRLHLLCAAGSRAGDGVQGAGTARRRDVGATSIGGEEQGVAGGMCGRIRSPRRCRIQAAAS